MPRTARECRLIPSDIPPRRGAGGVCTKVVDELTASGVASALVEMPGRKPQALYLGLGRAAETRGGGSEAVPSAGRVHLRCA